MTSILLRALGSVTGAIVNADEYKVHENRDGSVDKTRTDLYLHLVDQRDNSIMDVAEALRRVDLNIEKLDALFKVRTRLYLDFGLIMLCHKTYNINI